MTKMAFDQVLNIVENYVDQTETSVPYGPKYAVHAALHYLANSCAYRVTAETLGIPKSSAFEMTSVVIDSLVSAASEWIKWPTEDEQWEISSNFEARTGFPGIIGAVDGCHIGIVPPSEVQSDYINRKMQHSVNLMAVSLPNLTFTFVSAGECGRHHDSFVLKNSELWPFIESDDGNDYFPNSEVHLIGDSAFELQKHLLVPYSQPRNRELNQVEKNFNRCLSSGRACIENSFGFLKGRFRVLKYQIDADLDKISDIILACCVLHNISMDNGYDQEFHHLIEPDYEEDEQEDEGDEQEEDEDPEEEMAVGLPNAGGYETASQKRDRIALSL